MSSRRTRFLLIVAAACIGCARTRSEAHDYPSPTAPQPPLTAADTVTRLALDSALASFHGRDAQPIIVSTTAGHLTSRSLPHSSRFVLALLSAAEIQRVADDHGHVSYLEVYPVRFNGDTASVAINSTVAIGRPSHQGPVALDGATSCDWIVARHSDRWVVVGARNCVTLD